MCLEKFLNRLHLFYLNLKSIRLPYFVPIAAIFAYIPAMLYLYYVTNKDSIVYVQSMTIMEMQHIIPYFSIWWILFGVREYIEGSGKELLKVYKKSLIFEVILTFIWYIMHTVLFILIISIFLKNNYFPDFLVLLSQCVFFSSAAFFMMTLFNTISIPFLICTVYEIFFMYTNTDFASLMYKAKVESFTSIILPYGLILICSILLFFSAAYIYSKKHIK